MHKPSAHAALLMLALALALGEGSARADRPSSGAGTGTAAPSPTVAPAKQGAKKAPRPSKHRRRANSAPSNDSRNPSDKGTRLTALPDEQAAVYRAFAEHRQELVADAERAARAPKQEDRWQTVLYAIRDLDSHSAPAVCFWRAVAYYRMGELARARKTRQLCELAPRDMAALDQEDATAASLQPAAALPELRLAGDLDGEGQRREGSSKPVANPEPYAGPPPSTEK
jgi:hypothetical protein